MKKLFGLIVMLLFVSSVFAVIAQEGSRGENGSGNKSPMLAGLPNPRDLVKDIAAAADNAMQLTSDIEKEAADQPSVELCTSFLKEKFPNAEITRVASTCKRLKTKILMINNDNSTLGSRIRFLNQERLQAVKNLSEEKKAMLLKLSSDVKVKLGQLDDKRLVKIANLSSEEIDKVKLMGRERIKNLADKNESQIRTELAKLVVMKVKAGNMFQKRAIAQSSLEDARARFENATARYLEARSTFLNEKKAFLDSIKSRNETATMEHARLVLSNEADAIINYLEKVKTKVQDNDDLSEEDASSMVSDIDAKIAEIQLIKSHIDSAVTKNDILVSGNDLIKAWARMRGIVKLHTNWIINSKVRDILERSSQLETKLDNAVAKLEEKGYNVTGLNDMVDEFSAKIESARGKFTSAQDKLMKAKELKRDNESAQAEIDALVSEAKDLADSARADLNDAHAILKDIVNKVKDATGSTDDIADVAEEEYSVLEDAAAINSTE